MRPSLFLAALLALPSLALAAAPEPKKPLDLTRFMGRWYELMRIPNMAEHNCYAAHQDWSRVASDQVMILQTCHGGSPDGPERQMRTPAKILDPVTRAKFEATFFGGLVHRRYWVLDRAEDYGWMIASTDDGKYVSVLSREAQIPGAQLAALKARTAELGLAANRLVFVGGGAYFTNQVSRSSAR